MGDADFRWAEALRRAHFPPDRNVVPAHISLFHHLPPSSEAELLDCMARLCSGSAPAAMLAGVVNLGRGVAYRVESAELLAMREELADRFYGLLTPQDRATPRLHITIQNKVSGGVARELASALNANFVPRPLAISGLASWRYLDGPWAPIRLMRFRG